MYLNRNWHLSKVFSHISIPPVSFCMLNLKLAWIKGQFSLGILPFRIKWEVPALQNQSFAALCVESFSARRQRKVGHSVVWNLKILRFWAKTVNPLVQVFNRALILGLVIFSESVWISSPQDFWPMELSDSQGVCLCTCWLHGCAVTQQCTQAQIYGKQWCLALFLVLWF